jgi:peroxiredoxin
MPTIEATTRRLNDAGLSGQALQPGQSITDFELPDATGKPVKSTDLRAFGPVLIMFYRGHWCPFCNLALKAMQERYSDIESRGVTFVAISPQTPDNSLTTQEAGLQFPVLSDSGNKVARSFGIVFKLDDGLKAVQVRSRYPCVQWRSVLRASGSRHLSHKRGWRCLEVFRRG